ncbi:MAG: hypothetical protein DCC75_02130 [Proteobacteria bacterium]|nr:MAG: hypothetical protein DCC75_02130 [Pseudomonadota bacterium]
MGIASPLRADDIQPSEAMPYSYGGPNLKNELSLGLGYYDVVRLWGSANEKEEFEARRSMRWKYFNANGIAEVSFEGGKISAWRGIHESGPEKSREDEDVLDYFKGIETKEPSPEAEAILKEILSEVPSGTPDTSSGATTPPQPGMPEAIKSIE